MSRKEFFPLHSSTNPLLGELRNLIEQCRQQVAVAVNSTITLLYLQIGKRINEEVLHNQRADYGEQILQSLSAQLILENGNGWGKRQLHHCLRFAETFPDFQIVSAAWRQLSWTHIKPLIYNEKLVGHKIAV